MKKTLTIITLLLAIFISTRVGIAISFNVARPELVRPTSEIVDLTGKDRLEFKWLLIVGGNKSWEYYDFRLYNGYQMLESTLIYKEKLDGHTDHIVLNADLFQDGQVYPHTNFKDYAISENIIRHFFKIGVGIYTWSLRRIYRGEKSERSTVSFKVMKK